ncbi:ABC transporter ATP-binding protein/permease [Novosphingobium sp.]|uniref:ABC transporter ATP-binding protein/permease n=1 Tax=Novosphingobium sp. TaxID=1874826 RepID=UPI0028A91E2C|nr:ATP-binding cassette domain-containing protein [Novosphingobium sp.]
MTIDESHSLADPADIEAAEGKTPPESRGIGVWQDVRHAFALAKRYFAADPWIGGILLAIKLGIGAAVSFATVNVQMTMASVTSALAERNGAVIPTLLATAVATFSLVIVAALIADWVRYVLRMRARTVLTGSLLDRWLSNSLYYKLERTAELDHPEQRIQEDVFIFVEEMLSIVPSLIGSLLPLFLYAGKLWTLSPPIPLHGMGMPFVLEGYLVYATVGFALLWTAVTHFMGSKLTTTEITRQGLEAQFRQEMAGVRENGEAIAFQKGAVFESARLHGTFGLIKENWRRYTYANLRVTAATQVPTLVFIMGPAILCAPFVIDGRMRVGDMQFVSAAMLAVFSAVGVVIQSYRQLAILRSAVSRLRYFDTLLFAPAPEAGIALLPSAQDRYATRDLSIRYPDGKTMVKLDDIAIEHGARVLIKGRSGAGKSTFLRALAGLWQHGQGTITTPETAKVHFMPQRSYMPDGTLASLMAYPADPSSVSDERYRSLLERLGLERLAPRIHEFAPWRRTLSPGEQQRIAAARAIINAPDFLFVDEATSALDLHSEANFYTLLAEQLPDTAVISIAHRATAEAYHDTVVEFADGRAAQGPIDHASQTRDLTEGTIQ